MTGYVLRGDGDMETLLADHFRPVGAAGDLARRVLERLRDDWDPERLATRLKVTATGRGIRSIGAGGPAAAPASSGARRMVERGRQELGEYFAGRRAFFSVPVDLEGLGAFQRRVLDLTLRVPFGETRSYSWIARRIGHPLAVRAVGTALGRNPVPFIVPCHRILRADGSLGGYGLGLPLKTRLLDLERSTPVLEGCATTRIVCRVGCSCGRRMREDSRVVFASVEDAGDVGYRPCRHCRPEAAAGA